MRIGWPRVGWYFALTLLLFLPAFVSGTVTMSIIAAYFVNRSGGSVIPAIMVHGLGNDAVGLSGVAAMDVALSPYHQATKLLPFAVLAACIVVLSGRHHRAGRGEALRHPGPRSGVRRARYDL